MKTTGLFCMVVLLLAAPMFAQEGKTSPPVEQKQLELFLGNWEGEATYEGDGNTMAFAMKLSAQYIVGGQAVEMNPKAEIEGFGSYLERDLIAWDPLTKQVSLLTVSNMGEVGYYTGNWVEGKKNTMKLSQTKIVGNDTYTYEHTIFFHDGNKMTWHALTTKNDQASGTFKTTLTRK